jgi:hypothetical protein
MIAPEYRTVEEVCDVVRQLRDRLLEHSEDQSAKELDDTLTSFWTTSSEMIGEIKLSLLQVRPTVEKELDKDSLELLDAAVIGATKLWNG